MSIIVDIDGTLLLAGIYPIQKTIDWVNSQEEDVYIVSSRPEASRDKTETALENVDVEYEELFLNNVGRSHEDGLQSKADNALAIYKLSPVSLAVDNDKDARDVYSSLGFKTASPSSLP